MVSVMPCIAKKFERTRDDMQGAGYDDVDAVITTRELARMIKQAHIDFVNLEESEFDAPMGEATGAAAIFGTTGGVMEAALRTVQEKVTGNHFERLEYEQVRGKEGIKRASLDMNGTKVNVVVASGLKNAQTIMEETKSLVEAAKTLKEAKKFVILTYEEEKELNMDGVKIQVIPVWKWLLKMDLQNSLEMC